MLSLEALIGIYSTCYGCKYTFEKSYDALDAALRNQSPRSRFCGMTEDYFAA